MPSKVIRGKNTKTIILTPKITGVATSCAAAKTTFIRLVDLPFRLVNTLKAFSTTTTEPSTIRPIAIAKPPKDIKLAEMPSWFMTINVINGVIISVQTTIRLERISPRNSTKVMTTSTMPSKSTWVTVPSAESTNSLRS